VTDDYPTNSPYNEAELQGVYARACARSGIAILILVAISFIAYLRSYEYEYYEAVLEIAEIGSALKSGVSDALANDCWPISAKDRTELTITELYLTECPSDGPPKQLTLEERKQAGGVSIAATFEASSTTDDSNSEGKPAVARRIINYNHAVGSMLGALQGFDDEERLSRAMSFSRQMDFELHNWLTLESKVIMSKWDDGLPTKEAVWRLTIGEVQGLAEAFPIDLGEVEALAARYNLTVPNLHISTTLKQTALFLIASLIVFCLYFWANLKAAVEIPSYPAPGTLFYVFRKRRGNRIASAAFKLLMWAPAGAAGLLVYRPFGYNLLVWALATVVILLCVDSVRRIDDHPNSDKTTIIRDAWAWLRRRRR
jgi:hypothetical protein